MALRRALRVIVACVALACAARSDSATSRAHAGADAARRTERDSARPGARQAVRKPAKPDSTVPPFDRDPGRPRHRAAGTPVRQVAVTVQVVPGGPAARYRFDLRRPSPNPATAATLLRFSCAESGPVTITVYSVFGQRVATPVRGTYPPGEHQVRWSTTDDRGRRLMPGMYVIRMTAGRTTRTQKLAIAR